MIDYEFGILTILMPLGPAISCGWVKLKTTAPGRLQVEFFGGAMDAERASQSENGDCPTPTIQSRHAQATPVMPNAHAAIGFQAGSTTRTQHFG